MFNLVVDYFTRPFPTMDITTHSVDEKYHNPIFNLQF